MQNQYNISSFRSENPLESLKRKRHFGISVGERRKFTKIIRLKFSFLREIVHWHVGLEWEESMNTKRSGSIVTNDG